MKHIEELPKEQMLHLIHNLHKMHVTEKIDGSNLVFGFDEDGKFYTTRNNKGKPERFYTNADYENIPINNVFKAAHAALSAQIGHKPVPNTEYEIEILYGRQPNAIVYGSNRIVFIDEFPHALPKDPVTINTNMIFSDDGINTYTQRVESVWTLTKVPRIEVYDLGLSRDLTRDEIKHILVEKILRTIKPAFRDAKDIQPHEDFGVEGIVIKDPETGVTVKLVDRHTFTLINQFNFAIRNELKTAGPRFNPANNKHLYDTFAATVGYQKTSIYDTLLAEIAELIGIPGLDRYMSITRTLKKYGYLEAFLDDWMLHDLDTAKAVFTHSVNNALDRLSTARGAFLRQWTTYELVLTSGRSIRYTDEIYRRTLVVFAEIQRELLEIRQNITLASDWHELALALYKKQMQLAFPE